MRKIMVPAFFIMLMGFITIALQGTASAHVISGGCCGQTVSHSHPGSCHASDGSLNFDGHMYMMGTHGCIVGNNDCDHENHRFWNANEKKYGNNCCSGTPVVITPPPPPPFSSSGAGIASASNDAKTLARSVSSRPRAISRFKPRFTF